MNMMNQLQRLCAGMCLLFSFSLGALASPAGHIDFEDLSKYYGEPKVEVNLNSTLIGMVSSLSKREDPEVSELLSKLEFVKVRVYKLQGDVSKALVSVEDLSKQIRNDKWQPIVSVNDERQKVRVFSRMTDDKIDGLVVMVVEPKEGGEAVFINVVGEIDPSQISKVTESLNIDMGIAQ